VEASGDLKLFAVAVFLNELIPKGFIHVENGNEKTIIQMKTS